MAIRMRFGIKITSYIVMTNAISLFQIKANWNYLNKSIIKHYLKIKII